MKQWASGLLLIFSSVATAATIIEDTFTEGSDTALESHTSDSGDGWQGSQTTNFDVIASTDIVTVDAAPGNLLTVGDTNPSETDYFAEMTFTMGGSAGGERVGPIIRCDGTTSASFSTSDYYILRMDPTAGWKLFRYINGVLDGSLDADDTYWADNSLGDASVVKMKIQAEGTGATVTLNAWIDPDGGGYDQVVTNFADTDANRIVAANNPGMFIRHSNISVTYFNAEDLTSSGIVPITVDHARRRRP